MSALLVIFAEGYFWFLPDGFEAMRGIDIAQIILLLAVSIIALFSAPYFVSRQVNGFWQYNRQLLKRLFFTVFSSGDAFYRHRHFLGESPVSFRVADAARMVFPYLLFIVGLLSTTIFLEGIPKQFDHLDVMGEYLTCWKRFLGMYLFPCLSCMEASCTYMVGRYS